MVGGQGEGKREREGGDLLFEQGSMTRLGAS